MNIKPAFDHWISQILEEEKPGPDIIAWYFGIFETETGFTIYLSGSAAYDPEDDDWASLTDFEPADKYLAIELPESENPGWEVILASVKFTITTFTETGAFQSSFLNKSVAICTGFDDGDLERIR
ncbi:MAG: hypothetical protein IPP93_02445 [Chitinophagaceae bacterium]|nr:hypothetical protein [Chitinophagaceae bacterium]